MTRVAFVTTSDARVLEDDLDRPLHDAAFARAGVGLEHCSWDDPEVDWAAYDLVVLRSPWDYPQRLDDFLAWLDRVDGAAAIHNPSEVVRWNLDKRYLRELAERGVPVVATAYAGSIDAARAALARHEGGEIVVKPHISAGSHHTGRFPADAPAALALARTILDDGREAMIQPFAAPVAERGEAALVFFDGQFSHAVRKGPILAPGGGFLHGTYREEIEAAQPTADERSTAATAAKAIDDVCRERFGLREELLYARFDLVEQDDGRCALLEAELFEPSLFLDASPEAADRFARVVRRRTASE